MAEGLDAPVAAEQIAFYRQTFAGAWITQALAVAAELGLADVLNGRARTVEELAAATRSHPASLYRVLRALASVGVFREDAPRCFALTPLAHLLRSDTPGSQRAMARMMGAEFNAAWAELLHSARTGEAGFNHRFGVPFFQYMTRHPDRHAVYDSAMTGVHGTETQPMLAAYDFSPFSTVVDVGGGNGSTLAAILERHPSVRGVLFDLPDVANRAGDELARRHVADRCQIVGGDFFTAVPADADAYLLRHVIHDWQDDEAIAILRNCRTAMARDGRVLVVEHVLGPGNTPGFGKWLDLMMLLVAGRERSEEEYARLFEAAGLALRRVVPTTAEVSVLEAVRID